MNGAFYQEEVRNNGPMFKASGSVKHGLKGKQELFSDFISNVSHVKKELTRALAAVNKLNRFCNGFLDTPEANDARAEFIQILVSKRYIDGTKGVTYRKDMLGTGGILDMLTKLDQEVGKANGFVVNLGEVGTSFLAGLDVYLGTAQNKAVEQGQVEQLEHIRNKGNFLIQVASKTKVLETLSNQVSLKIQAIHQQTKNNNEKRNEVIKACLKSLHEIDAMESTEITTTINSAMKDAEQIASSNRVLNKANEEQLGRDKEQVVNDVTHSMEVPKKWLPITNRVVKSGGL
jgi:hypothetical protein